MYLLLSFPASSKLLISNVFHNSFKRSASVLINFVVDDLAVSTTTGFVLSPK